MTSIMRRTVRGAATGLGALAIVAGTAACGGLIGGGDDGGDGGTSSEEDSKGGEDSETTKDEETTEETTEETGEAEDAGEGAEEEAEDSTEGDDDAAAGSSDEGGDQAASGEALSEEDLTAVGDVYFEFLQAAAAQDGNAACSLITHPATGEPLEGAELSACAEGFEGETEDSQIDPSVAEAMDRSMVEGVDNGDGTAGVTLMGSDGGVTFIKASDGKWYIDGSKVI